MYELPIWRSVVQNGLVYWWAEIKAKSVRIPDFVVVRCLLLVYVAPCMYTCHSEFYTCILILYISCVFLDDASLLSTAFGVVGSYLTPDLSTALRIRLALPAPKRSVSQSGLTAADDDDAPRKKSKSSEIKPDDDYSGLVSHTNTVSEVFSSSVLQAIICDYLVFF